MSEESYDESSRYKASHPKTGGYKIEPKMKGRRVFGPAASKEASHDHAEC